MKGVKVNRDLHHNLMDLEHKDSRFLAAAPLLLILHVLIKLQRN